MTELVTTNRGYQKPRPGQKLKDDVLRLIAALDAIDVDVAELLLALADKSNVGHGHAMDAITGLAAALGNKLDVGHHDALGDLTDVDIAGVANGMALLRQAAKWIPVALQINNIAGLEAALNGKATPSDLAALKSELLNGAGPAFDTFLEFAAALGNDPNFAATVGTALGLRVRADAAQVFNSAQQGQARANVGADVLAGHRNKIINGDFDVWQRGLGQTASGYGSVDRWNSSFLGGSQTVSRQFFPHGQTDVPGNPRYFYRNTVVSAGAGSTNYHMMTTPIEGVRTLSGRKATLTFYAKADAPKNIGFDLVQYFGTGGAPSATLTGIGAEKVAVGTGWTKISRVIDIPSIAGKLLGSNLDDALSLYIFFEAGTNYNARTGTLGNQTGVFDIAHVSLVEGDATADRDPFSPRPVEEERLLCFRYFERKVLSENVAVIGAGVCYNPQLAIVGFDTAAKRAKPTLLWNTATDFSVYSGGLVAQLTGITAYSSASGKHRLDCSTANGVLTMGYGAIICSNNGAAYMEADAEL